MRKHITIIAFLVFAWAGFASAREVPINPITPDIRDKLKESAELVGTVEDGMAPKVSDLEKIYKTYVETCKDVGNDRGCVEIQDQIRAKYKAILSSMADDLPKLKQTVSMTAQDLGKSIRAKTHSKDIKDLYEHLAKKGSLPKIRGPLSKKLSELLKAMGRPNTNVSILELSLQTQADLISASEFLEYLEAEISRQVVVVDMVQDFGVLSPEMASVMKGVADVFGYDVDFGPTISGDNGPEDDWRK